jgi:hypothetical protein
MEAKDYLSRRIALAGLLQKSTAKVLIYGRQPLLRSATIPEDFHQFSDLVYLSGYTRSSGAITI